MHIYRGCGVLLMAAVLMSAPTAFCQDKEEEDPSDVAHLPLVVLQQQEVQGRVFFVGDEGDSGTPAGNLRVQLHDFAGTNKILETKTDVDGNYVLPSVGQGAYRLSFGRLTVDLKVVDPVKASSGERKIPKSLLIFLPRSLVQESESDAKK